MENRSESADIYRSKLVGIYDDKFIDGEDSEFIDKSLFPIMRILLEPVLYEDDSNNDQLDYAAKLLLLIISIAEYKKKYPEKESVYAERTLIKKIVKVDSIIDERLKKYLDKIINGANPQELQLRL